MSETREREPQSAGGAGASDVVVIDAKVWRRIVNGLLATAVAVLLVSALWVSQQALQTLDRVLVPEFDRDAEVIARTVGTEIERAQALGIPFDQIRGVETFLSDHISRNPALVYIAATDAEGQIVFSAGDRLSELAQAANAGRLPSLGAGPVVENFSTVRNASFALHRHIDGAHAFARLQVGMDRSYAERQISDIRWDVLVVLIVSVLITFELLVFVVDRTVLTPLRLIDHTLREAAQGHWTVRPKSAGRHDEIGRVLTALDDLSRQISQSYQRIDSTVAGIRELPDHVAQRLEALRGRVRLDFSDNRASTLPARVDARLPLFLFVFAEELSRAFLPLYAEKLYVPLGTLVPALEGINLTPSVVVALPIVVFMAFVAIATPFGGSLVSGYGPRRIFLAGAVPAIVGYLGTAGAATVFDLLLWRSLSAVGYAVVTIAAQGYIAGTAEPGQRARAMATFVGAVTTAVICGSSIGAVLADRLGYRATFLISGLLVLCASAVAARYMQDMPAETASPRTKLVKVMRAFFNARFAGLVLLAAIPAKIALTGFLFYLTPLYLSTLGVSEPAIGRTIMLYGIFMIVGTQLGAFLGDRQGGYAVLIGLGGLLTGAALAGGTLFDPTTGTAVAIAVFGLAQGIASAPMLAILPQICPQEAQTYGTTSLVSLLRLSERIGSVIGPLLAATLIAVEGFSLAILVIAGISAATAVLFLPLAMRAMPAPRDAQEELRR